LISGALDRLVGMSLNAFKSAIRNRDYAIIAKEVRAHKNVIGFNDNQLYRLALSADPSLERGNWEDIVKTALERHPA
jgi:hypothetical protein